MYWKKGLPWDTMNQTNWNSLFFPLGKLEDAGKIKKTFIFSWTHLYITMHARYDLYWDIGNQSTHWPKNLSIRDYFSSKSGAYMLLPQVEQRKGSSSSAPEWISGTQGFQVAHQSFQDWQVPDIHLYMRCQQKVVLVTWSKNEKEMYYLGI